MVTIGNRRLRVAVGAGHRHTLDLNHNPVSAGGANPFEFAKNGENCVALMAELRKRADVFDAWCYTPQDGAGLYPGNYNDAAASVASKARAGWVPDFFVELHSEGGGGVSGSFVIYPNEEGDIDATVRDHGGIMAANLRAMTGMPVRTIQSYGVMAESQSGVGQQGFRLGVFGATVDLAATTTRLIFESGAHDAQPDLSIMQKSDFSRLHGLAVADALEDIAEKALGWTLAPVPPAPPAIAAKAGPWKSIPLGHVRHIAGGLVVGIHDEAVCNHGSAGYEYASKGAARSADHIRRGDRVTLYEFIVTTDGRWVIGPDDWRYPASVFDFDAA